MTGHGRKRRIGVADDDLHAYVDRALGPVHYERVQAHLIDDPHDAAKVQAYAAQNLAFHSHFAIGADGPADLRIASLTVQLERKLRCQRRFRQTIRTVGVAVLLLSTAWVGWGSLDFLRPGDQVGQDFVRQAATAHRLFAADVDGLEHIASPGDSKVVSWLSQRVAGVPLRAPDLSASGYRLARDRVLPSSESPAALLVYEHQAGGDPLTLYIGKRAGVRQTSTHYLRNDDISTVYWQAGPLAYSLVGRIDRRTLLRLAGDADAQLRAQPPLPKRLVRQPPPTTPELTHTKPIRAEPAVVRPGEADSRDAVDETRPSVDDGSSPGKPEIKPANSRETAQPEKT